MTTLAQAMLEAARFVGIVHEGTATGGSTTTLVDTALSFGSGYFNGGTLWVLSGDNAGVCTPVVSQHANGTITISTQASACDSGNRYALATDKFTKAMLQQAVNYVLRRLDVTDIDTAHSASDGVATLSGISNVRRVYTVDGDSKIRNFHWKEIDGKIVFDDSSLAETLEIWYVKSHGELSSDSGEIADDVHLDCLIASAAVYLWRNYLQKHKKDDPTALDMLNEAKTLEATARRYVIRPVGKDPHWARW
jgi:hypothetical protein